jgi:hypothetical protein
MMTGRMAVVILLPLLLALAGCKGADLRKQADGLDGLARQGERAADALDRSFATADKALAWVADPVNQAMLDLFPPAVKARIGQAVAAGQDVRPALAEGVAAVREASALFRGQADDLRTLADAERAEWINFLGALALGLGGVGGIGALIGRTIGVGVGAAKVAKTIEWGKVQDPEFAARFDGPAGDAMRASLAEQPAAVQRAVLGVKS